ncbi:hypothetical protein BH09MYX1_BH09MYX1_53560 [soil metagenome]
MRAPQSIRSLATLAPIAVAALAMSGCGLDQAGALHADADAGIVDVSVPSDVTVLPDAAADVPVLPQPDAATCLTTGPCTASVPLGWILAVAPDDASTPCPTGYVLHDALAEVVPKAAACDCMCNVTKDPVCDSGSVTFKFANDNQCAGTGVTPTFPGCKDISLFQITSFQKAAKLPPSGGTCTVAVKEDKTQVEKSLRRTCDVPPTCAEDMCAASNPGWAVCITNPIDIDCPPGWQKKETVGADFDLGCSACPTCDVNGPSSCNAAAIHLYSDNQCATEVASFAVDGNCGAVNNPGVNVHYAKYAATLSRVCTTTGNKTAAPALKVKSTICCK